MSLLCYIQNIPLCIISQYRHTYIHIFYSSECLAVLYCTVLLALALCWNRLQCSSISSTFIRQKSKKVNLFDSKNEPDINILSASQLNKGKCYSWWISKLNNVNFNSMVINPQCVIKLSLHTGTVEPSCNRCKFEFHKFSIKFCFSCKQ